MSITKRFLDSEYEKKFNDAISIAEQRSLAAKETRKTYQQLGFVSYDQAMELAGNLGAELSEVLKENEELVDTLNEVLAMIKILAQFGPDSTDYFIAKQLMSPDTVNEVQALYAKAMDHQKRLQSRKGASARLENDKRLYAKEQVYKSWVEWTDGRADYGKRNSQADFARAMLKEWEGILVSQPSIEEWCRQWKRGENIPLIEPAQ